jgi:hypothetical protein
VTAPTTSREVEHSARRSVVLAWAVRGGLVGYGLLHFLVAWIALRLILTSSGGSVTGQGALAQLAGDPLGRLTLLVMAVGFAAMVVWQLIAAAVGYHDRDSRGSRLIQRLGALCRAAVWVYLAVTTTRLAVQSGTGGGSPNDSTATVMSWPAGALIVALVGVVVVGVGVGLAIFGWRLGFVEQLDEEARSQDRRRVPIVVLGRVGYVAKGVACVVIGVLLVWAAWTHDPHKSVGLDGALYELIGGRLGQAAIIVVALGLTCYGLFLLARARHLNRDSLTS